MVSTRDADKMTESESFLLVVCEIMMREAKARALFPCASLTLRPAMFLNSFFSRRIPMMRRGRSTRSDREREATDSGLASLALQGSTGGSPTHLCRHRTKSSVLMS